MNSLVLRYGLPIAAAALLAYALATSLAYPARTSADPAIAPARSPYAAAVAGMGVVEPNSEIVAVGPHIPGVIEAVHVRVEQRVRRGAPLFTIDRRDTLARLAAEEARLASAQVAAADAERQYELYRAIDDKRAVSQDELDRRRYAAASAAMAVAEANARIDVLRTELARLTVHAPLDATVLRVDARAGEYAPAGKLRDPLIALGNVYPLHVRVEIDESDAARFSPRAPAVARVRGVEAAPAKLRFVRAEAMLKPRRTLTGDGNERVDTRVLEAVYALEAPPFGAHVGQQVDVFIDATSPARAGPAAAKGAS